MASRGGGTGPVEVRHHGQRRDPELPSQAVEDYAKTIFGLERRAEAPVTTSALATRLGVAPASVTAMLKRMAEGGLVEHEPYRGVRLTSAGKRVALEVIRHHRLIEAYLADALGMPWDRVHAEAEVLEHYISEELEERMATALGNPDVDPHGDPIPSRNLEISAEDGISLAEMQPGQGGTFSRVSDSDSEMLRYLAERGIRPGSELAVTDRQPFGGPLFVQVAGETHAIGGELAQRMVIT